MVVALALSAGCGADGDDVAVPGLSPAPSTTAPTGEQATCADEPVEQAVCRFLDAARSGEVSALSEGEQAVAGTLGDELPDGTYVVEACELIGDVTVACEVSFDDAAQPLGFHVGPVNAEFLDGQLITPEGEDVRYEVVDYLGTGEPGSFTVVP